jgi:hypothetical protein
MTIARNSPHRLALLERVGVSPRFHRPATALPLPWSEAGPSCLLVPAWNQPLDHVVVDRAGSGIDDLNRSARLRFRAASSQFAGGVALLIA